MENLFGEFVWWQGVVEDRADPKKLGRCKVRVVGYHTDDKTLLPTADLPWAYPVQPITSAAMSGIGYSPLGPVEGTWVLGFFRDGVSAQEPIMLGTIGGKQESTIDTQKGFSDPNGIYPTAVGEEDTHKLARGVSAGTIVDSKKSNVKNNVSTANGGTWSEPPTPFAPSYPKNHTYVTESGHVQEFDDTVGKERTHLYHKSGTFIETHPDGTQVMKIVKDKYEIVAGDDNVLIEGNASVTINGTCKIKVIGNTDIQVTQGNVTANIDSGDLDVTVSGSTKVATGTSLILSSGTTMNLTAGGTMTLVSPRIDLNP